MVGQYVSGPALAQQEAQYMAKPSIVSLWQMRAFQMQEGVMRWMLRQKIRVVMVSRLSQSKSGASGNNEQDRLATVLGRFRQHPKVKYDGEVQSVL